MSIYEEVRERIGTRPWTWLVTGAAGFIRSHLQESRLRLNQQVVAMQAGGLPASMADGVQP